jgi:hypothetical protein
MREVRLKDGKRRQNEKKKPKNGLILRIKCGE